MGFWTSQGQTLFTGLLGAIALCQHKSMKTLTQMIFNIDKPHGTYVPDIIPILVAALDDPLTKALAEQSTLSLNSIWNSPDDDMIGAVYATARTVVDAYMDPAVIAATDLNPDKPNDQWVDLDWLMDTGTAGTNANTLYFVVSDDDFERLAPVIGAFLTDLKTQAYRWDVAGHKMPAPLLMLIDEAGQIPLKWLPKVAATCRGVGIQLVTIWQSLAQIHEAYGKLADSVITNHPTKLFFPGCSDETTLGYLSKIIGEEELEQYSWTSNPATKQGRSISGQTTRNSLVPYHVPRLAEWGQAVMIHANTPPVVIHGRQWWNDPHLRQAAAGEGTHAPPQWDPLAPQAVAVADDIVDPTAGMDTTE